jgi:hypothetical protein
MRQSTHVPLLVALSVCLACAPSGDGTTILAPGQEVLPDANLHLRFVGVSSDSRCAPYEDCLWAGNAAVEIELAIGTDPPNPYTLNTYLDPKSVDFAGYRVTLADLTPHPPSCRTASQSDYRAHLLVTPPPAVP